MFNLFFFEISNNLKSILKGKKLSQTIGTIQVLKKLFKYTRKTSKPE